MSVKASHLMGCLQGSLRMRTQRNSRSSVLLTLWIPHTNGIMLYRIITLPACIGLCSFYVYAPFLCVYFQAHTIYQSNRKVMQMIIHENHLCSILFWFADRVRLFVQYTIPLSSLCKLIWRHWTYKMPVRYILSSVWVRLSIFSQLSIIQYMGLCVFSLPISLVMIERI